MKIGIGTKLRYYGGRKTYVVTEEIKKYEAVTSYRLEALDGKPESFFITLLRGELTYYPKQGLRIVE